MATEIKRVSYAYNQAIEDAGQPGYFLDCFVSCDGRTVVDKHETFTTRKEFFEAVESVIPLLEEV